MGSRMDTGEKKHTEKSERRILSNEKPTTLITKNRPRIKITNTRIGVRLVALNGVKRPFDAAQARRGEGMIRVMASPPDHSPVIRSQSNANKRLPYLHFRYKWESWLLFIYDRQQPPKHLIKPNPGCVIIFIAVKLPTLPHDWIR